MRAGINTDDTKYYTIVAEIDSSILKCASDIILSPPATGKYETLKSRLMAEFSESDDNRFKRLFDNFPTEGRKPSALLREIKDLSGGKLDQDILKSLWLRQLPTQIQQILATVEGDIDKLATRADAIMDIQNQPKINCIDNENSDVHSAIMELTRRFDRLERGNREARKSRPQPQAAPRRGSPQPRSARSPSSEICWYHRTFGEKATKCRQPCNFRLNYSENW